jgi:hypothetical protein
MNRRGFVRAILPVAAAPFAAARIGSAQGKQIPKIERDINSNSWSAGWADTTRVNMEYSNSHQHTNGRQLEFSMAQHSRYPGDNTGVRWADFTASGAPAMGYYWPNNDRLIWETDNFPSHYLPWKQWVCYQGFKIIDIGNGVAIKRWPTEADALNARNSSTTLDMTTVFDIMKGKVGDPDSYWKANYNPACLVNPTGTFTMSVGGGYYKSFPNGVGSIVRVIDDNPNYPATSSKPLRLRAWRYSGPSPTHMRHCVQIGQWIYWGGGGVNPDSGSSDLNRHGEFYRIYVPDLLNGTVTQEAITIGPAITNYPGLLTGNCVRYNLLCADQRRKWLIYINVNGVYRYIVPTGDGPDGGWEGPYTFGLADWAATISDGNISSNWHGVIGTHRSDLNQTFFRYNLSRKWNRIRWS